MKRLFVVLAIFVALSIAGLAIASPSMQGAFPQTGILDDFNRSDEGPPPSANWTTIGGSPVVYTNEAANTDGNDPGSAVWNAATFGPDCETYATFTTRQSNTGVNILFARMDNIVAPTGGYILEAYRQDDPGDTVNLSSFSTPDILVIPITLQDGDAFGMRLVGSTIAVYQKPVAGVWTLLGSVVNTETMAAGYIGFSLHDTTTRMDDFGGGEITVAEPTPTPTITPTGVISSTLPTVCVAIPNGQAQPEICVVYSVTIGEIMTGAMLLLLVLIISGRWLYDVAIDVFQVRNAAIGSWVSRKLYKRWINRMVE
jgi:hypothetical protein